jgi:predicted metal-binding membrane protein
LLPHGTGIPDLRLAEPRRGHAAVDGVAEWHSSPVSGQKARKALRDWIIRTLVVSRQLIDDLRLVAGVYQFTPLKNACLRNCRAAAQFLSRY